MGKLRSYDVGYVRMLIECASLCTLKRCSRVQAGVEGFDGEKASIGKGGQTEEHLEFACAISVRITMDYGLWTIDAH